MSNIKLISKLEELKNSSEQKKEKLYEDSFEASTHLVIEYIEKEYSKFRKAILKVEGGKLFIKFIEKENETAIGRLGLIEGMGYHSETLMEMDSKFRERLETGILDQYREIANTYDLSFEDFFTPIERD